MFENVSSQIDFCRMHNICPNGKRAGSNLWSRIVRYFDSEKAASAVSYDGMAYAGGKWLDVTITFHRGSARPTVTVNH